MPFSAWVRHLIARSWSERRERGSAWLVRLMIWLSLRLGWQVGYALLFPIALYFYVSAPHARAASRTFLQKALARPVAGRDVLRHIFVFSNVLFDRLFFLSNRTDRYHLDVVGLDGILGALAMGRGCVLLGSHLGSFEALRSFGRDSPVPVKVLMYRDNKGPYTRLVEALDPALSDAIIEIGRPGAMLRMRDSLRRGEIIGILADRVPHGQRTTEATFLGVPAAFPTGPARLAATLDVPVVLFFGFRTGPRRYALHFEPLVQRSALDPGGREAQITACVRAYAARLEAWARRYPFNWFNFYDFWDRPAAPSAPPATLARRLRPRSDDDGRIVAPAGASADR
jgi:predicted LPLAT superfamily acyltransferase